MFKSFALLLSLLSSVSAQIYTGPEDSRLVTQLSLELDTNGISTTPDGRLFFVVSHFDGTPGTPSVVEYDRKTNTSIPYPNKEWNTYSDGDDPGSHYLNVGSQRI